MKHLLIQELEANLKGHEFQMTNAEGITHWIYPCDGCGSVMYHLYDGDDLKLAMELNDVEALDIARKMWNRVSDLAPMSKRNFVAFLIYLKQVHETKKASLN